MIAEIFKLKEKGTDLRTEVVGGATTFMTMSYIIFVQPIFMSAAGMDFGAVMMATCISSAVATVLMGLLAGYPIALAPAMGHNAYFAFTVCGVMGYTWQMALGANFISGCIFLLLSFFGFRSAIMDMVPGSLKSAIAAGIGLLIALIGLEWSGIVVPDPNTYVKLGELGRPATVLAIVGLALTLVLMARGIKGAIFLGIVATAFLGYVLDLVPFQGIVSAPPSLAPTLLKLDIHGALSTGLIEVIFVFFFLDLFDTIGTLIGVSHQAGFLVDGRLPKAERAMASDAAGTVVGTLLGTSTVTSYVESAAGVAAGARTGLANLVTAALFLLAMVFSPMVKMIGGGVMVDGVARYPVIALALIIVGSFMMTAVKHIEWDNLAHAFPTFLTIIIMPLTFSITEGMAFGIIAYVLIKLAQNKAKDVSWLMYLIAALFAFRYVWMALPRG